MNLATEIKAEILVKNLAVNSYVGKICDAFLNFGTSNIKLGERLDEKTSKGYHIEFVVAERILASEIFFTLKGLNINSKQISRKNNFVVYISGFEEIAKTLNILGLNKSLLVLENESIARNIRKQMNREINSLAKNQEKQSMASEKQLKIIAKLEKILDIKTLPVKCQKLIKFRKQNQDASLSVISEETNISKSEISKLFKKWEMLIK